MPDAWNGVPLNPERDGWHWLCASVGIGAPYPMLWSADGKAWDTGDGWEFCTDPAIYERRRYLGPCHTPAEITAREAASAEAMNETWFSEIEREADRLTALGGRSVHEARALRHFAGQQRARIPRASALARAFAEAEKRGMERAAKIADRALPIHGLGGLTPEEAEEIGIHQEIARDIRKAAQESEK